MDAWGRIYEDHWSGERRPHVFVRDDGIRNVADAAGYFEAPRCAAEQAACESLEGRVLDLGCGPGSYSLFLEARDVGVVAIDSSPGAIRVCSERGCRDARIMDLADPRLDGGSFDALICMGNTIGINQSPKTLPSFLAGLRRLLRPGGRLVVSCTDPLTTTVPTRLEYQAHNRARGLPPGLVRLRLEYRGALGDWWIVWLPTKSEFEGAGREGGWTIESFARDGSAMVWVLRPAA